MNILLKMIISMVVLCGFFADQKVVAQSVAQPYVVWGVHSLGKKGERFSALLKRELWFREGVTSENLKGTSWAKIDDDAPREIGCSRNAMWGRRLGCKKAAFREAVSPKNPKGTGWIDVDSPIVSYVQNTGKNLGKTITSEGLTQISCSENAVWGVNSGDEVWFREGVTPTNPKGTHWIKMDGSLEFVACCNMSASLESPSVQPDPHFPIV